jgi:hypothetical protein
MSVKFIPETHKYISTTEGEEINWISVTTLIGKLKQPFDKQKVASRSSRSKKSKWYGMTTDEIIAAWEAESQRAINVGNWYHNQREEDILGLETLERHGIEVPIIQPQEDEEGYKIAPSQRLKEGVYPEHFVYMKSIGVCGQADLVEVVDGQIHITDYKTNKEIKESSYVNWEGISQKMNFPVSHMDDCNLNHYNLQLSIYMYMMLRHNPKLRAGEMIIQHVMFEKEDEDENGYPILAETDQGEPVIKEIKRYSLPYLKEEVQNIIHWLNDNRHKL